MPVTSWIPSSKSTNAKLGTGRVWKSPQPPQAYTAYQSARTRSYSRQLVRL
jgi:hypothetical protein